MKSNKYLMKLYTVNWLVIILLFLSIPLIRFEKFTSAFGIVIFAFFLRWKLFRCPNCNRGIPKRTVISRTSRCPYCMKLISVGNSVSPETIRRFMQ